MLCPPPSFISFMCCIFSGIEGKLPFTYTNSTYPFLVIPFILFYFFPFCLYAMLFILGARRVFTTSTARAGWEMGVGQATGTWFIS